MSILKKAFSYLGTKEFFGSESNPVILDMLQALLSWVQDDEINWCSAFVHKVLEETGYETSQANAAARSWLNVGQTITDPAPGDVVVFWRVARYDWRGHVGFFLHDDGKYIWVLGGNQNNEVNVSKYSRKKLLGFRRPVEKSKLNYIPT